MPGPILLIDDADAGCVLVGSWAPAGGGYRGGYHYSQTPTDTATFSVTLPFPGPWRVAVTYQAFGNRSDAVPHAAYDGATLLGTATVNEQVAPADCSYGMGTDTPLPFLWLPATFTFAGTSARLVITAPSDGLIVCADALIFAPAAQAAAGTRGGWVPRPRAMGV